MKEIIGSEEKLNSMTAEESKKNIILIQDSKREEKAMFENEVNIQEVSAEESKKENIINEIFYLQEGRGNGASGMVSKSINIKDISVSKHYPRKDYGDMNSLKESIHWDGMLDPLRVYKTGEGVYSVTDGARRLKAAEELGMQEVECIIEVFSNEAEAIHSSFVRNSERNNFSPMETALQVKTLIDEFKLTHRELEAKKYGSHSSISNMLQLLKLPIGVQKQIHEGKITAAHGLALCKLPTPEEQEQVAKQICDNDLTVKKTEDYVYRHLDNKRLSGKDNPNKVFIPDADIPEVKIKGSRNMGEQADNSVKLIVSSTRQFDDTKIRLGTYKNYLANINYFAKEAARVVCPGGVIALITADVAHKGRDGSKLKLTGPVYLDALKKNGAFLTDVIIGVIPTALGKKDKKADDVDQPHTFYRINNNCVHIYIYRVKGERENPPEEIISQSKLTKEQVTAWTGGNGLWKIGMEEMFNRLIRMYSYVGDTVLDSFLGNGIMLKVAKELGRVGIGYEKDIKNKPAIMKNLGLIPEETAVKSSKLMSDYVKQTMPPEATEVKSSEPEAEFFIRRAQSESDKIENLIEAICEEEGCANNGSASELEYEEVEV
jgi:ParB family chromosome partitioning protein